MNNNKKKIFIITGISLLVLIAIIGGTYAWYSWNTSDDEVTKIAAGIGTATVTFDGGSDINANLRPVSDKSKGIVKTIKVKSDTAGLLFNMYLDITSIDVDLKDESFRYEFYRGTNKVKEGNFSDSYLTSNTDTCSKNNTKHIVLLTGESISTVYADYTLYIWIDGENYENPSTMMNKTFSFKLHADGEGAVLAESPADKTLKQLSNLNSTIVVDTTHIPDFSTASGNSGIKVNDDNGTETMGQGDGTKGIYVSEDDLGKVYYFRGAVENNYVKFANFYWRIIRINGDGSIRMIYAGKTAHSNGDTSSDTGIGNTQYNSTSSSSSDNAEMGYMYGTIGSSLYEKTHENSNDSKIKKFIDNWYKTNLNSYTNYLQDAIYCNDRSVISIIFRGEVFSGIGVNTDLTAYSSVERNFVSNPSNPSLKCTNINDEFTVDSSNGNGALTYPVGLITTDEIIFAGGVAYNFAEGFYIENKDFYLFNGYDFWTMTPNNFAYMIASVDIFRGSGFIMYTSVDGGTGAVVRPVISLKSNAIIGGDGTINNPFVVE